MLRGLYDYVVVDVDKRLDDTNLGIFDAADIAVRGHDRGPLVPQERAPGPRDDGPASATRTSGSSWSSTARNAFTGINVKNAEGALKRPIDYQVVNEYRGAISALNSGAPFMFTKADSPLGRSVLDFARAHRQGAAAGDGRSGGPTSDALTAGGRGAVPRAYAAGEAGD